MADISNKADELVGRAKQAAGDATGNDDLHAQGVADEARTNVKKGVDALADKAEEAVDAAAKKAGDVKDSVVDAVDTAQEKVSDLNLDQARAVVLDNRAAIAAVAVAVVAFTVLERRKRNEGRSGRRSAVKRAALSGVGHALAH